MRVVRLSARRRDGNGALDLFRGIAAVLDGSDARFVDLEDDDPMPFASVEDVVAFALGAPWTGAGATAAASHSGGELSVLRVEEGRVRPLARLDPHALALGATGPADRLLLSETGRYLAAAFPVKDPDLVGIALIDLHDGTVHGWLRSSLGAMRAGFGRLPSGAEVLLVSADYLGVLMLDCASGKTLASYDATSSFDFVHVAFALSEDATRLFTWGCVWAAPYEVRLYDARPWTAGAPPAKGPFPLPLVFRDDFVVGTSTAAAPTKTADGAFTHVSLVGEPPDFDPERLAWIGRRSPPELEVVRRVRESGATTGLVIRRVDPADGRTLGFSFHGLPRLREEHVHVADGHRVFAFSDRVWCCDASGGLEDGGPVEAPGGPLATAVTDDGAVAVIVARE